MACRHGVRMGDTRRPDVRVTMIDHDTTFVESVLRYCARFEPDIVIAHITDIADLRAHSRWSRPDIVTLDPDQLADPAGAVLDGAALPTRPWVMVLTMTSDSAVVAECAGAGAAGWVGKYEPVSALVDAIRGIHRGEARYPMEHLGAVMRALTGRSRSARAVTGYVGGRTLSRREQEILVHLLTGATPREIADLLHLSTNTIRSHRRRIEAKLGLHA